MENCEHGIAFDDCGSCACEHDNIDDCRCEDCGALFDYVPHGVITGENKRANESERRLAIAIKTLKAIRGEDHRFLCSVNFEGVNRCDCDQPDRERNEQIDAALKEIA